MYYLIRDTPFEMIPSSLIDNPLDEDTPKLRTLLL